MRTFAQYAQDARYITKQLKTIKSSEINSEVKNMILLYFNHLSLEHDKLVKYLQDVDTMNSGYVDQQMEELRKACKDPSVWFEANRVEIDERNRMLYNASLL